jgi:hypothetical protein
MRGTVLGKPGPSAAMPNRILRCNGTNCTIVEVTPESRLLKFGAMTSMSLVRTIVRSSSSQGRP